MAEHLVGAGRFPPEGALEFRRASVLPEQGQAARFDVGLLEGGLGADRAAGRAGLPVLFLFLRGGGAAGIAEEGPLDFGRGGGIETFDQYRVVAGGGDRAGPA